MSGVYPWDAVLTNLWVTALVVAALFSAALLVALGLRRGRHDGVDLLWGAGCGLIALTSFILARGEGDYWRQLLITTLSCVWGLRLTVYIALRNRGTGEDRRYTKLLQQSARPTARIVRKVYLPQAAVMWTVSLPVQLGQYGHARGFLSVAVTVLGGLCKTLLEEVEPNCGAK